MPERTSNFLPTVFGLLFMAFGIGFFMALLSIGQSGVLYQQALSWEIMRALLSVANWAPAILLVASATSMEISEASDGFSGAATRILAPALIMAAVISIFYILAVPKVEELKNRYADQGRFFTSSLQKADEAYRNGDYELASKLLDDSGAIDNADSRWIDLNGKVKLEVSKTAANREEAARTAKPKPERIAGKDAGWDEANKFYLQALKAREDGRLFDAHYLAKRSAEMYSKRPEVQRLVKETWFALEQIVASKASKAEADYYRRKLEGYSRFQEEDYLQAFRIFSELVAQDEGDADVRIYLTRSTEGLSKIAFFTEEAERAFSRSEEPSLMVKGTSPSGDRYTLKAEKAAISDDAIYLRNATIEVAGKEYLRITAPYARLHGDTVILRAVDRKKPYGVFEPTLESGSPIQPAYAIKTPFLQQDVITFLQLSGAPADIPIDVLMMSVGDAGRLGAPVQPLLAELAKRSGYPFAVLMLALLGAGIGVRFKPVKAPKILNLYLTAPILVALAIPPIHIVSRLADIAAQALSMTVPYKAFIPAWFGFLGVCVVICLLVSARIASSKTR